MIKDLDSSSSAALIPLLVDLGYPDQEVEALQRRIENFLSNSNTWLYGYYEKEELIGFGSLSFIPLVHEDGYLARVSALAVKKSSQSKGIGRKLMNRIEETCQKNNAQRIEVTSSAHREQTAHPFYERLGYKKSTGARFVKNLSEE